MNHSEIKNVPKLLIIGIDGGTWEIIQPLMDRGDLPVLSKLIKQGIYGNLQSVFPPITATAWPSFFTGDYPDNHGIYHFYKYDNNHKISICNYNDIRSETLFSIFSRNNLKINSIDVPMTYPPPEINGKIISGFPVPETVDDFTYPRYLKRTLEEKVGFYEVDLNYSDFGIQAGEDNWAKYDKLLAQMNWVAKKHHKCITNLLKSEPCDVFFTVYTLTDRVQHFFWKFYDENHPDYTQEGNRRFSNVIFDTYRKTDKMIGELLEHCNENTSVLILSDHGFGRYVGDFNVAYFLNIHNFMSRKKKTVTHNVPVSMSRILEKLNLSFLEKIIPERILKQTIYRGSFEQKISTDRIDWENTMIYPYKSGVRVNLKNREEHGIIDDSEKEVVLKSFCEKLEQVKDSKFPDVDYFIQTFLSDTIYESSKEETADLFFSLANEYGFYHPVEGYSGQSVFSHDTNDGRSGTHKYNGMFILNNTHTKSNHRLSETEIVDLLPTILYLHKLRIPKMDGNILIDGITDDFLSTYKPKFEEKQQVDQKEFSNEEEEQLKDSLRALGYID